MKKLYKTIKDKFFPVQNRNRFITEISSDEYNQLVTSINSSSVRNNIALISYFLFLLFIYSSLEGISFRTILLNENIKIYTFESYLKFDIFIYFMPWFLMLAHTFIVINLISHFQKVNTLLQLSTKEHKLKSKKFRLMILTPFAFNEYGLYSTNNDKNIKIHERVLSYILLCVILFIPLGLLLKFLFFINSNGIVIILLNLLIIIVFNLVFYKMFVYSRKIFVGITIIYFFYIMNLIFLNIPLKLLEEKKQQINKLIDDDATNMYDNFNKYISKRYVFISEYENLTPVSENIELKLLGKEPYEYINGLYAKGIRVYKRNMEKTHMNNTLLNNSSLININFSNSYIESSKFYNNKYININFSDSTIENVDFSGAIFDTELNQRRDTSLWQFISEKEFNRMWFDSGSFKRSNLEYVNFQSSILMLLKFDESSLKNINMSNSFIFGTEFNNVTYFSNVDFSNSFLRVVNFNFEKNMNIYKLNLTNTLIDRVRFKNVTFVNADFSSTILSDVDFTNCSFLYTDKKILKNNIDLILNMNSKIIKTKDNDIYKTNVKNYSNINNTAKKENIMHNIKTSICDDFYTKRVYFNQEKFIYTIDKKYFKNYRNELTQYIKYNCPELLYIQ
ncbi:MAG: pentapeptide repeat-containing protein [Arcobacteraceae bacterium]|nr:pentapeptide repeat-containing protein [Arcobacteraceae bacterium]